MKFKLFLLLSLLFFSASLRSDTCLNDEIMWESAYRGDVSLVHRLVLSRECTNINDDMISQFAMVYLYHRLGRDEDLETVLKGVDAYIEYIFEIDGE